MEAETEKSAAMEVEMAGTTTMAAPDAEGADAVAETTETAMSEEIMAGEEEQGEEDGEEAEKTSSGVRAQLKLRRFDDRLGCRTSLAGAIPVAFRMHA